MGTRESGWLLLEPAGIRIFRHLSWHLFHTRRHHILPLPSNHRLAAPYAITQEACGDGCFWTGRFYAFRYAV